MMAADRVIRWTTAGAVLGVAAVAAVASYEHAYDLARMHGESGWTARLIPFTADGLIYASSMVMRDSARRKRPDPALARWLLGLGIAATLAANVAHGLGRGTDSGVMQDLHTVEAAIWWPSLTSSPCTRLCPHVGFSVAMRITSLRIAAVVDGRPRLRRLV